MACEIDLDRGTWRDFLWNTKRCLSICLNQEMRIFVSWSGPASHEMAILLREWLIRVLQYSDPFVSSKDINKGAQWLVTISEQLSDTSEGIICVTPSNVEAPWLNYEAGALAKTTGQTAVRTVLLGMNPGDLPAGAPLSNFQHTAALDRDEMWSLIESIHSRSTAPDRGDLERIRWAFDQAWTPLLTGLQSIDVGGTASSPSPADSRDEKSLILDLLREVKELSIAVATLTQKSEIAVDKLQPSTDRALPRQSLKTVESISAGTEVLHETYGRGIVMETAGSGDKKTARIRFPTAEKKLLLRYAPMKVVSLG